MKKLGIAALAACALLLTGCEDTPSSSVSEAQNKKTAEGEAYVPSMKVVDFVRENAWYDQGNKMRYIVRHNYNLQLTKSFGDVAVDITKAMEKESEANTQGGLAAAAQAMGGGMFVAQMQARKDYKDRFQAILRQCQECSGYLFKDDKVSKDVIGQRIINFHLAWNGLAELGFPEANTTPETKVARQAWSAFMKTEKGWMPASN